MLITKTKFYKSLISRAGNCISTWYFMNWCFTIMVLQYYGLNVINYLKYAISLFKIMKYTLIINISYNRKENLFEILSVIYLRWVSEVYKQNNWGQSKGFASI